MYALFSSFWGLKSPRCKQTSNKTLIWLTDLFVDFFTHLFMGSCSSRTLPSAAVYFHSLIHNSSLKCIGWFHVHNTDLSGKSKFLVLLRYWNRKKKDHSAKADLGRGSVMRHDSTEVWAEGKRNLVSGKGTVLADSSFELEWHVRWRTKIARIIPFAFSTFHLFWWSSTAKPVKTCLGGSNERSNERSSQGPV